MKKLVVLASGSGSNFQAMLDNEGMYKGKIIALIVDRKCNATIRAQKYGIPVIEVLKKECNSPREFNARLLKTLTELDADYYLLAGFMSILSKEIVNRFTNRIINIHPSLLPAFPGVDAIKQALEYGVKVTGCTIHFVDEGMDTGPIIAQKSVDIEPYKDFQSLTLKIHELEHGLYLKVIQLLCQDLIEVKGRKVEIKGQGEV